jgi:hypothetical protein
LAFPKDYASRDIGRMTLLPLVALSYSRNTTRLTDIARLVG